jgi:hypothetical protein
MDEAALYNYAAKATSCTIEHMTMTCRVSATLDTKSEAALYRIMESTGWTKSQVLREAIWAVAESQGLARRAPKQLGK